VLRLRGRIAGIFLTVIGAIFLIIGVFMMVSAGWTTTTATADGCVLRINTTQGNSSHLSTHDDCQMTWVDGGVRHTAMLNTERNNVQPGQTFTVKVSGDNIALPSPLWGRLGTLAVGAVAVIGGLALAVRRPRSER
jgi:hypothetical protein